MILTKGQEEAIKVCVDRYKNKEPYTVIAGAAGSGKTTVVPYIISALGLSEDDVVFVAPTGKAALVLRDKGCKNAMTLHKLLYIPEKVKGTDSVIFIPRTHIESSLKLIVVDEASMVSKEIFDLLLSHKIHIIFFGDHFQLPAISEGANILDNPHVILTEITRQSLDSPIIRLSMDIREGKDLTYGGSKEARIIPKNRVSDNLLLGADITLVGKNITRHTLNETIRKLKWGDNYQESPLKGDTLMCLKNCWDITDTEGETPLINGMMGTVSNITTKDTKLLKPKLTAIFTAETGEIFDKSKFNIDYQMLIQHKPTINETNWKEFSRVQKPLPFAYSYACTVHKAQGSQWDRVLVYTEVMGDKEYFYRWLYTSATRAVKQVILAI